MNGPAYERYTYEKTATYDLDVRTKIPSMSLGTQICRRKKIPIQVFIIDQKRMFFTIHHCTRTYIIMFYTLNQ